MSLMRRFLDRRKEQSAVVQERRRPSSADVDQLLRDAIATMERTVGQRKAYREPITAVVRFDTFAEICEYRYSPENSLMRLCKHKEHPCAGSGISACKAELCPRGGK